MRKLLVSFGLLLSAAVTAAEEPRELVARAIRVHGGENALRKAALAVRAGSGSLTYFGRGVPFTDEVGFDLPDRLRVSLTLEQQPKQVWVINGDKGWQAIDGMTTELPRERVDELREEAYVQWVATLAPLTRDEFVLKAGEDAKVEGKPSSAVRVSARGRGEVTLYFDKESGLLVRLTRLARQGGVLVEKEYLYSAHKDFGGAKLPTRIAEILGGKKFSELTTNRYEFLRGRDESLFRKP